jgi:branched-chain amino acid transport system substrate-binding protein
MRQCLTGAIAILFALAAHAASADTVKVGLIADYTGAFATWGTQFQQGIEAYQAVHGKSVMGPDGKPIGIEFIYRDSTSAGPDKARQLAEDLVLRERVKFLAGFDLSPQAMAVSKIATQAKIPTVIMNAATASIVRMSPYFVRVSMTIPQYTAPVARWAAENGIKTVYMIICDYAPGYDAESYFSKVFEAHGGKIIGQVRTPLNETNFSTYLEKALEAKPDAVFMFQPGGAPSIAFVKAYIARGLKEAGIKLLGTGEMEQIMLPNFNDDVIGTVTGYHYTETSTRPENVALRAQLEKLFGPKALPTIASVAGWDGTALIYLAVEKVGADADGSKYVDAMKGMKLDSPRGPMEIDPATRDVIQNVYIRRVEKRDGTLVNIDIGQEDMVKDPWKVEHPEQ